jgi:hypothetical protein
VSFGTQDPAELTELLQPFAPGVRTEPTGQRRFRSRIRAWGLADLAFFSYSTQHGSAVFSQERPYVAISVPLFSSFDARVGSHGEHVQTGRACVQVPGVVGEITPSAGAHVQGFAFPAASLAAHRQAVNGTWNESEPELEPFVPTTTEIGERLLRYLASIYWTRSVSCSPRSGLHRPRRPRRLRVTERPDTPRSSSPRTWTGPFLCPNSRRKLVRVRDRFGARSREGTEWAP